MDFNIAERRITLPNSWHEVTLGQLLAIRSGTLSTLDVIAILSNEAVSFWRSVNPADIVSRIMPYLEWSNEAFDWNALEVPDWFGLAPKTGIIYGLKGFEGMIGKIYMPSVIAVPMNLDLETYGQKVFIESLIGNDMPDAKRVPMVLAAYFEPIYSGLDFNTERLADFLPVILQTSCTEALPIYSFFYRKYSESMVIGSG
jgi:hypothetical protein